MDALSDVLRKTRLKGGVFLHANFADPWCLGVRVLPESCNPFLGETAEVIPYHYVLEGRLRVRLNDITHELQPGELIMFPRNDYHLLGGDLNLPPTPSTKVLTRPEGGGLISIHIPGNGGPQTHIVCGFLAGEQLKTNPVVCSLPPALCLDYRLGLPADWIRSTLKYAADEIARGRAGSETVFAKISELLFVEAIRCYVETLPEEQTGWLAGLKDPYISRALGLLHTRLREAWTVDALGRETGLSRSALADRFNRVIGMPPMQYLTQWRIQVAAQELINSSKSIAQIAHEVGYDSEASLTRAFKRQMGAPPAAWRRGQLAPLQ